MRLLAQPFWLWAYFHDYPITKVRHWEPIYYCEHVIYMHNTNSHYAKKLSWIPPLCLVFGSKPYTSHLWIYECDIHIWIAPPPFIRMGSQWRLRNYFDYEFIDGKVSHRCRKYFDDSFGGLYLNFPTLGGENKSWPRD